MTDIRVRVADIYGRLLEEIEPDIKLVSWRLSDVGQARITMARTDDKATAGNLAFGNRLLLEFSNGLPDWGGVIDPPREWEPAGIGVNAYSGEYVLGLRRTSQGRYFSNQTVGEIFTAIINEANVSEDTGLRLGNVWGGGDLHSPEYHLDNLLETVRDSICGRLETAEFVCIPFVEAGLVHFRAQLYQQRGRNLAGSVALLEGHNIINLKYVQQGPLVNDWLLAGAGTSWALDGDRPFAAAQDADSRARYGLRQDANVYPNISQPETLQNTADGLLGETAAPHDIFELEVVDLAPAEFGDYDVGDTVRLIAPSYGFDGIDRNIRITGREFTPATGLCRLVVRVET